ncbi:IS66 family insertion sequence element accessory protein TnpA [Marinimicrobium koreense]|uniref:IS66 family insertion sequence element accessory protein TnpA n=1 Tax=Marinimicrobium koreense TaxID=306545 RepID=UPI003F6FE658|tara:strand:- start:1980 stop:2276 length:297 start_codon:yes stop_codon:yes gene_type:complete
MTNTYTPRRSTEQWQSLVHQWQQSGQSAKQFCKEQAVGYASFCQWRKRLTQTDETAAAGTSSPEPSFIDLASLGASQPGGWHIVLSLGGGVELTLSQS